MSTVQNIFSNRLWQNSDHNTSSVYVTQVARPIHVGGRFPLNPNEKEWYIVQFVVVRVGSIHNFTEQLYRLESEVRQIKNRDPCPKHYKATTVEYVFRERKLHVDWCSFKLINPKKVD
ncbi:hypothetical protein BLA29_010819 [Euroglyphus maynei]|uniref:Sarcoglycan alpha/epsilon second domain-containing protein n=1 Tax=Euroglyphus maynei TaxID=6958 RepID=A0A1Y3AYU5_EURMA|nr:hypothetical protein BLA29_010819 [Euroglyphus maynei]